MNNDELKIFGCVGLLLAIPFMIAISAIVGAFVTMMLWGWFVVPVFGLPSIGLAVGLYSNSCQVKS